MIKSILALDRILRGQATTLPALQGGEFEFSIWSLCILIDLLGLIYGLCMGIFALTGGDHHAMQVVATMLKVPALFLLTLTVTMPSLYVFNALIGSRLTLMPMIRLLVASMAVMLAVLSSIGPIVGFFSFTTTSYPFMIILNVIVYAIAGFLGLAFLLQTLHRMSIVYSIPDAQVTEADASQGPLDPSADHVLGPHVRTVFRIWVIVFGLVGAQMSWVLRPFIGQPGQPFSWFRPTGSNFFEGVAVAIKAVMH